MNANTAPQPAMTPSIFQFEELAAVRTYVTDDGEPWFCVKDFCGILGYANDTDAIQKHCRVKGVAKRATSTSGGVQQLNYINEGNLYRLIIKSRKKEAEPFEAWVCDELLPTIRKTGGYSSPRVKSAKVTDPTQITIRLDDYVTLMRRCSEQTAQLANQKTRCQQLQTRIDMVKVLASNGNFSIEEMSKIANLRPHLVEYIASQAAPLSQSSIENIIATDQA